MHDELSVSLVGRRRWLMSLDVLVVVVKLLRGVLRCRLLTCPTVHQASLSSNSRKNAKKEVIGSVVGSCRLAKNLILR
jgi:hypothetical protein